MKTWFGKKYGKNRLTPVNKSYRISHKKLKNMTRSDFTDGFFAGSIATAQWRSQPNPPKVYVFGNRVHHGLVGLALAAIGYYYDKPYLTGYGTSLVLDDIDDLPQWLNFENASTQNESAILEFKY